MWYYKYHRSILLYYGKIKIPCIGSVVENKHNNLLRLLCSCIYRDKVGVWVWMGVCVWRWGVGGVEETIMIMKTSSKSK